MNSLNEKILRLATTIETVVRPGGVRLVKQQARGEYLALLPEQQRVLAAFDGRRTVGEVLSGMLAGEQPVRLRAFYDAVLDAREKGFLLESTAEPAGAELRGRRWPVPGDLVTILVASLAVMTVGSVVLVRRPLPVVAQVEDLLGGWLLTALGVSLAYGLAGCALSGLGREVYQPRIRWRAGLPFFSVDVRDAFMAGRTGEVAVALAMLAGPFLLAVVAGLTGSAWALLGAWVALLIQASPFGGTPAHRLWHALLRRDYGLPRCAEQFLSTRMVGHLFHWREPLREKRYFIGYTVFAVFWLGLVSRFGARLLEAEGAVLADFVAPSGSVAARMTSLVIFGTMAVGLAAPLVFALWVLVRAGWRGLKPVLYNAESVLRRAGPATKSPEPAAIARFLGGTLLFSQLPPGELEKVAAAMRCVCVPARTCVIRERDTGQSLFVVYSGSVEVLKENEAGQNVPVATLGPGDVFGEIALLDKVRRTSTVRSDGAATLLALDKADFEELLHSVLGAKAVRDTVQISAFLRRNPLFADWHPQPLLKLSAAFVVETVAAGTVVLREHQPNDSFFLIKEGDFAVRVQGRPVATLGAGDFFGEISLLRGRPTNAEVACVGGGVCLRLGRTDFLQLISQGFATGLAIEHAAEVRTERGGGPRGQAMDRQ